MFLKKIELFGFKSFADKTEIEFTQGISAVLGPNGCGKSNVVDAIKWVLGEQATKSLRAEKMEDVIFNGTEDRKALNVAEVTLILENNENLLQLDAAEIAIKRRLFRSGESEYYLNNTPVRLKELRELFLDTGVGKTSYSIMEQGKIDQILSTKPEERRHIFEEAASITKYKYRGQEAERKLKRTDENIGQIQTILSEVKRSYDNLQKQAQKTKTCHALKDRRFEIERNMQLLRLRDYLEKKDAKNRNLEGVSEKRNEVKSAIDGINEHLESNLDQVNTMESALNDSNKRLYGLTIENSNIGSQIGITNERVREIEESIAQGKAREAGMGQRKKRLSDENDQKKVLLQEYGQRLVDIASNIDEFRQRIGASEERVKTNQQIEKKLESGNVEHHVRNSNLQKDLQSLTDDIVRELDEELRKSGNSMERNMSSRKKLGERISQLAKILKKQNQNREDFSSPGDRGDSLHELWGKSIDELQSLYGQLDSAFKDLEANSPNFLQKFLAPQGIITQKRQIDTQLEEMRNKIEANRRRILEISGENEGLGEKIKEYRSTLQELLVSQERLKAQQDAVRNESTNLVIQINDADFQIQENRQKIAEDQGRLEGLKSRIGELERERDDLKKQEKDLQQELNKLEKGISSKNKELSQKERELQKNMDQLGKVQDKHQQLQMELTEIHTEIRHLYGNFRERFSRDLSEFEELVFEIQESLGELKTISFEIREEIKSLGSVNLMAIEEFAEVKERYDFLSGQLQDLETAKADLEQVTRQIREESARMFVETYDKIKKNFHSMFRRLFGGGRAELRLMEPENVLESGIAIYAQPPGKKLENIALLSGGERSLTAVAMLFATYMVKPSPFCLLDEIDAALDESNVVRFITMLMEFAKSSQFIIITHNKKTVAGANTLLGVTMEESGVSKAIAIRLGPENAAENAKPDEK